MVGTAAITEDMLKRRWSASILRYLEKGVTDPAEITKNEASLTASIMSQRLRTMLRFGLVARFPRPAPSKVVEFRLTPRGRKILKMLDIIDHLDELDQQLAINGKPIEEDIGIAGSAVPGQPAKTEIPPPEQPVQRKKSSVTALSRNAPLRSMP